MLTNQSDSIFSKFALSDYPIETHTHQRYFHGIHECLRTRINIAVTLVISGMAYYKAIVMLCSKIIPVFISIWQLHSIMHCDISLHCKSGWTYVWGYIEVKIKTICVIVSSVQYSEYSENKEFSPLILLDRVVIIIVG